MLSSGTASELRNILDLAIGMQGLREAYGKINHGKIHSRDIYWAFGSQTGRTKINHVIYEGNEEENATCWGCNDAIRASRKYTDWAGTNISNKDMVQF